jgi:hypothetical protein
MSQETVDESQLMFGIAVLFSPYRNEPDSMPQNYKYVLADSNQLDLQVSTHDQIQFAVKFGKALRCKPVTGLFAITGRQQKSFIIEVDGNVVLSGGLPMGKLSIGVKGGLKQTMILFKVSIIINMAVEIKIHYCFVYRSHPSQALLHLISRLSTNLKKI